MGNLGDITLRTLDILARVDYIASEDTRVTKKLLSYYQIKKPLFSYHAYNFSESAKKIISLVREGFRVALVSDAGMPTIQDPGKELISLLERENIQFEVLPGPSALILGVVYSGFKGEGFLFLGFLPRKKGERKRALKEAFQQSQKIVLYESPQRLLSLLEEISQVGEGDRQLVICRELTKIHQEIKRGQVERIKEELIAQGRELKGEIVLVIEGKEPPVAREEITRLTQELRKKGLTQRDIVEVINLTFGVGKNVAKKYTQSVQAVDFS